MSRLIEQNITCPRCGEMFHGYGRGENGENKAYWQALKSLRAHECFPLERPDPLPRISGADLDAMIQVIEKAMPDVTFTRRKV